MLRFALLGTVTAILTGCDAIAVLDKAMDAPEFSCFTNPQGGCSFDQTPLRVEPIPTEIPNRPYKFFPTAETMNFVDAGGRKWVAPRGTLTDGASIPEIFTTIVGAPTAPEYISAAAVHDAYCGIGNESGPRFHDGRWQDVHHMFYNGLIVGGTPQIRAKIMYAAVWLGGPRWETTRDLSRIDTRHKQWAMVRAKSYIEQQNPTLQRLDAYLEQLETQLQPDPHEHGTSTEPSVEDEPVVETPYEDPYDPNVMDPYDPSITDPYDPSPYDPSVNI